MAVWRGIRMAIDCGSVPFIFESDSLQAVELVNKGIPPLADVGSVIGLIISLLKDLPGCAVSHIPRDGNKVAHHLAREALSRVSDCC
ncbi:hypothetical protein Q3G72_006845 [Acer saccharum]|nr:hypothetical protein Q3G72_006845 [Acer saccharum]